jgi:hypothetical protein
MSLSTSNFFDFVKPPDFNILIRILCLVIVAFYNTDQHVDCKIADTLLKKGTKQHADGWDTPSKVWAHMVYHLPNVEGGFGVILWDESSASSFVRDESSDSNDDVDVIPSHYRITQHLLSHWQSFGISNLCFQTLYFGRRWLTLSLRKRMTPRLSSSLSP